MTPFSWRGRVGTSPILLIAGAQKCGTTTLHDSLARHPRIRKPRDSADGKSLKEVNFFNQNWSRGMEWYEAQFPEGRGIYLDSTPNYLSDLDSHERMAEAFPDAQILVSLRDPVERAYSAYNHYTQDLPHSQGWDWERPGESFACNVEAELEAHGPADIGVEGLVGRGHYAVQLRSLLRCFPSSQVHVFIMESWIKDPRQLHRHMLRELGLSSRRLRTKLSHVRSKSVPPMSAEVRDRLSKHYSPHNSQLEGILGREIREWDGG
ncbi:MAG: hypothetical protein ACI82F_003959 [Planctomycetota bacterium]|jgi:hypothetical protein